MPVSMTRGFTRLIVDECRLQGLLRNQAANVLAQIRWETGGTMEPVRETFAKTDALAKSALTKAFKAGKLPWVKADYWSDGFFGRGFLQITHRDNYAKAGKAIGVDMVANPSRALEPNISAAIAVRGMKAGWFRAGQTLARYLTLKKSDHVGAREIVNGDKNKVPKGEARNIGAIIAGYAREYEAALKAEGYGEDAAPAPPAPVEAKPGETLQKGMTGKYVDDLQRNLAALDYYHGPVNGSFDTATEKAVEAFQAHAKLLVDGKAGIRTNTALGEALKAKEVKPKFAAAKEVVAPAAKDGLTINEIGGGVIAIAPAITATRQITEDVTSGLTSFVALGPWVFAAACGIGLGGYIFYSERQKRAAAKKAMEAMS